MTYYAVFDTNVLVSSLLTKNEDAATAKVIYEIASKRIIPIYSKEIFEEYNEVLHRDKFPFTDERIDGLLRVIVQFGILVEPTPTGIELPDEKDVVFYEVVMDKRDDDAYLITGNKKHFPDRQCIVTPSEMMDIIDNEWYCNYYELHDYFKQTLGSAFLFTVFTYTGC